MMALLALLFGTLLAPAQAAIPTVSFDDPSLDGLDELEPLGASHTGTWSAAGLRWETEVVLLTSLPEPGLLLFAWPVPQALSLEGEGITRLVIDDAGDVVAIEVAAHHRAVRAVAVQQPVHTEPPDLLQPPMVDTHHLQRVDLVGLSYEPAPALGLERRLTRIVHPTIEPKARRSLDRLLDHRRRDRPVHPVYLTVGPQLVAASGLPGEISPSGNVGGGVLVAAAAAFGGLVLALLGLSRLFGRAADDERVQAYIQHEFVKPTSTAGKQGA